MSCVFDEPNVANVSGVLAQSQGFRIYDFEPVTIWNSEWIECRPGKICEDLFEDNSGNTVITQSNSVLMYCMYFLNLFTVNEGVPIVGNVKYS